MKRIRNCLLAATSIVTFLAAACSTNSEPGRSVVRQAATGTTIATTAGTAQYVAGSDPLTIDPTLTITSSDTISAATVAVGSGFVSAQDVLVFATTQGITGTYSSTTGILSLSGTASVDAWQSALRSVRYSNSAGTSATAGTRTISFSLGGGLYLVDTGHFYEFVTNSGINWGNAYAAAKARTYFGLTGYLATVTSAAENAFIASKLSGYGWMGAEATDTPASPTNSNGKYTFPRTWYWVTGPEATAGTGGTPLAFFNNTASGAGTALNSSYTNFDPGEPNNAGNEAYLHFLTTGRWNDFAYNNGSIAGYVVEYGGMSGDPTVTVSASRNLQIISQQPCVISGTTYSHDTANPANPCQVCDAGVSRTAWTLRPAGYPCTSDGLACTSDTCNAAGACVNTLVTGCLISGACVAANATNPSSECQACIPATSTTSYSPKARGVACTDDGKANTLDICDGASTCTHVLGGTCTISGSTYNAGTANPSNPCASCDPNSSASAWTNRVSGYPCSADALACTADTCNGSGSCVATLYTGCLISGACIASGTTDPSNSCNECNPAKSTSAYSAKAAGVVCTDDGNSTTADVCDGSGACTHPVQGSCVIGGVTYAGGTANPTDPCAACDPSKSTGAWSNRVSGYPCTSDGLDCTADTCDGAGTCGHTLFTGCLISGACVTAGTTDPYNDCQECNPAKSTGAYVAKAQGVVCTDDGKSNTLDVCDGTGTCTHPVKGSCTIDSAEYVSGAANSTNVCEFCDPATSASTWTSRIAGYPCTSDSLSCTTDTCDGSGVCQHTLSVGCLISGACVTAETNDPYNDCRECNPTASTNSYVSKAAGITCGDDGLSNTLDVCNAVGQCTHPLQGSCVIGGTTYAGGAANPDNPCQSCDPSNTTSGWSDRVAGFPCTSDNLTCTLDTCDGVGACAHTLFTGCLINNACVAAGTTNAANDCQECNPAKSTTDYVAKAQGLACTDDGDPNTLDVCDAAGTCTHPVTGACAINGTSYPGGTANPDNACEYCEPSKSATAWTSRVQGFPCASDGLDCTSDTCDATSACVHTLFTGCLISAGCVPAGNTDPSNDCQACNPSTSTTAYTPKAAGVACADDGNSTTLDVCGSAGQCTHPLKGTCVIAGTEYAGSAANPDNPCAYCDPTTSATAWSNRIKGYPCTSDSLDCTLDSCDAVGVCQHALTTGCLINGACVAASTTNTANDCQECNPAQSTSAYVAKAQGVACTDDGDASTLDICDATGTCTHPVQGSCTISGTQYVGGAANPTNACEYCNPAAKADAWSVRIQGFPCTTDDLTCTADTCDGAGTCKHELFTGCLINGACVATGTADATNECRECNPNVSTSAYVAKPSGVACTDDNNPTTIDMCDGSSTCTHVPRGTCVIAGVEYAGGAANPTNACAYCDPTSATGAWTNRVQGFPCASDNLDCTADTCDGAGTCGHTLTTGCMIGGVCVAANATNPANGCQECDPAKSTSAYVAKPAGVVCADDGDNKTLDVCSATSVCTHSLKGTCQIAGTEYAAGTANPQNACASCDPSTSVVDWTKRVAGYPCATDGLSCTADTCDANGACSHTLIAGCSINNACVVANAADPANDCQECNPAKSTSAYVAKAQGVACADDGDTKTLDVCDATGACTHPLKGSCVIDGLQFAAGAANPQNVCAFCDPSTSFGTWTNRVQDYPCATDSLSCTADTCDGSGTCHHTLYTGCLIEGECVVAGATNPADSTKVCDPTRSTTDYVDKPGSSTDTNTDTDTDTNTNTNTTACTVNSDCPAESYCKNKVCVSRLPDGQACTDSAQCASGSCGKGTCNAIAYVGGCQASPGKVPAPGAAVVFLLACAALIMRASRRGARRVA